MRDSVRDGMRDFIKLKNCVFTAFAKAVGLWDISPLYTLLIIKIYYNFRYIDEKIL